MATVTFVTTAILLNVVQEARVRGDVVPYYAAAIRITNITPKAINVRAVNEAIAAKWSWSAVDYIKRRAWDALPR